MKDLKVIVGLSGGVDSAVAALLLLEQGLRVEAVTFLMVGGGDQVPAASQACTSASQVSAARCVADHLGIPHQVIDLSGRFYELVIEQFVRTYARGWTPNPCITCNAAVRIPTLVSLAHAEGAAFVATGHYARVEGDPPRLYRGLSEDKDQSYVLSRVAPRLLSTLLLPLGRLTKEEVRDIARKAALPVSDRPDSQDICFVPDRDHRRFLSRVLAARPGDIVDLSGRKLGRHTGIHNFTIGQRRGLGIASSRPLYVLAIRSSDDTVVVGPEDKLLCHRLRVRDLTWHECPPPYTGLTVKIRSMGRPVPAELLQWSEDEVHLDLGGRERAAAPGQTAVVYQDERVVCAGTIVPSQTY